MASAGASQKSYFHSDISLSSAVYPLTLRNLRPGEGGAFAALLNSPGNGDDSPPERKPVHDEKWGEGAIQRMLEACKNNPTVVDTTTGEVVSGPANLNLVVVETDPEGAECLVGIGGYGAIKNWERGGKRIRAGDTGIIIDAARRGKGYGAEAMRLAMDWAAAPASQGGLQLDIITITTLEDNQPMIGLTENKLGLKGTGVLRPAEFEKDKQEMYFEIPSSEWRKRRSQEAVLPLHNHGIYGHDMDGV